MKTLEYTALVLWVIASAVGRAALVPLRWLVAGPEIPEAPTYENDMKKHGRV